MDTVEDTGKGEFVFECQGFAVEPKRNCPHITEQMWVNLENNLKSDGKNLFSKPCKKCDHKCENWICLTCSNIYCSRYIKGHMIEHNQESQHPIVLSFSDLSYWCYLCESYISNYRFDILRIQCSNAKYKDENT